MAEERDRTWYRPRQVECVAVAKAKTEFSPLTTKLRTAMSTALLMQLFQIMLVLGLGTALAVSAIRLMWIAGSFLKRKSRLLP